MQGLSLATHGYIVRTVAQAAKSVPLAPELGQVLLAKSLELPLPVDLTEAKGIFQSDIIIRSAIVAAIADLRANPWLLDYVFSSLPKDTLTMRDYGEQEVEQAKKWFLATDIPVVMSTRMDDVKLPCISIALLESSEAESTLGDVHYQTAEAVESAWPVIAEFRPSSYNASTGVVTLPVKMNRSFPLFPNMVVLDAIGKAHVIKEVLDDSSFRITPGTVADFSLARLKAEKPQMYAQLESLSFKETYHLGCHAQSEPVHLTYLHSILVFVLLRYKQALLEARGFERSVISSSDMNFNPNFENEVVYSRFINVSGFVRQYWPKLIKERVLGIDTQIQAIKGGKISGVDVNSQIWTGDEDDFEQDSLGKVTDTAKKER
jgi:hypothetical protein